MAAYLQAIVSHLHWDNIPSIMPDYTVSESFPYFSLASEPDTPDNWITHLFGLRLPILQFVFFSFLLASCLGFTIFLVNRRGWTMWGKKPVEKEQQKDTVKINNTRKFPRKEKVRFYYNKWLNKVNSLQYGETPSGKQTRLKSKQIVEKIAKNFINRASVRLRSKFQRRASDVAIPRLLHKELPASYLEELQSGHTKSKFPPEVVSMMRAIRLFGHLEEPVFLELCRQMVSLEVDTGQLLFQPGDKDDSVYMVQRGRILVYITDMELKREMPLKEVKAGENITSMLSILDVLAGTERPFRTVTSRALEPSTVVRIPVSAFGEVLARNPEALVRVVQLIMTRLQRVTFSALRDYLGLTHELMKTDRLAFAPANAPMNSPIHTVDHVSPHHGLKYAKERSVSVVSHAPLYTPPQPTSVRRNISPIRSSEDELGYLDGKRFSSSFKERSGREAYRKTRSVSCFEDAVLNEDNESRRARRDLIEILGLKDASGLEDRVIYKRVQAGMYLTHEFDNESSLYYVVSGSFNVSQKMADHRIGDRNTHLFVASVGEIVGTLAVLTGEPSLFNIRAKQQSKVLVITRSDFFDLLRENPQIILATAHCFSERMSGFVRQIDFALDWEQVESGRAIYRQGEEADSVFVILNGRVRSVVKKQDGSKEPTGEYARGDLLGLAEVSVHKPRMTTVIAVRDSEIARIPTHVLEYIKLKYPKVVSRLINILGTKMFGQMQQRLMGTQDKQMLTPNLSTVAIVAVSSDVPIVPFCLEMEAAMNEMGSTLCLSSRKVEEILGPAALDPVNEDRLALWLGHQEDSHRMVLFHCDHTMTTWTKQCLRQADCILIVANGDRKPTVGNLEKQLDAMDLRAEKKLVLLHRPETVVPKDTAAWLNMRGWVSSHHHVKCTKRMFLSKSPSWFEDYYTQKRESISDKFSDFSRLGRVLMGKAVGLVLGGGGARGAAHVGVIKAMMESGVPIDMIGGTSIGAFVSGLWAEERNITAVIQRGRSWFFGMNVLWKQILDLTYPYTAMFKGTAFNREIENTFKDRQIEDLWIPYFTVTTDISSSSMRVHKIGDLWRYVRASMSLSGYLPPLCDPADGHLLLDGGYVNNLPADVMQQQGANFIFAVDVGSQDDYNLTNYGDELSGWWLLFKRWFPFGNQPRVPTMAEVQTRLAYVSCVRTLEIVKKSDYCVYVRPPIESFKTLDFKKFDLICTMGYDYGKGFFTEDVMKGRMDELFAREESNLHRPGVTLATQHSRALAIDDTVPGVQYSFTDLAQIVAGTGKHSSSPSTSDSSDDLESAEDDETKSDDMVRSSLSDGDLTAPSTNVLMNPRLPGKEAKVSFEQGLSYNAVPL